eukprot:Pompholyxophrys_sp_v1_NODE_120_length_1792_cov_1.143351.p2 type:complete len:108 gc:universal NODE_120_length_1792_cov_1.143351:1068-745(-)
MANLIASCTSTTNILLEISGFGDKVPIRDAISKSSCIAIMRTSWRVKRASSKSMAVLPAQVSPNTKTGRLARVAEPKISKSLHADSVYTKLCEWWGTIPLLYGCLVM